ncbi:39S ribosomal protein L2, mitochondrial-like [Daphnia pulicaria]|uniref:39S ribosomal protein L2, mitochondrial-like n=1 Tax=Daphnia pulicaria TaxID=35523 RepID=UPI001EEA0B2B|nr:39S ribosomal protein L2, mitochondrial-like [Daphnia pulicaria]
MMQQLLNSFSRLCVTNSRLTLSQCMSVKFPTLSLTNNTQPQLQQIRCINKLGYLTEPGWRNIGNKWLVKFPEEYTVKKLQLMKLAGRDPTTGKKVYGGLGGGHKKKYRWVDNLRSGPKEGPPLVEKILRLQYDPCRSSKIALVAAGDRVRYILASSTMKVGDLISTSGHIPRNAIRPKEGDAHPLGALPVGTEVCCVEKFVGEGASIALTAGSRALLVRKVGERCILQLPSKQELSLKQECMATVGHLSNEDHNTKHIGSPNRLRWLGFRPRSGLWHRKDGRHGRKIRPLPPIKVLDSRKSDKVIELPLTIKTFF